MKISTKTGDTGKTKLMFGKSVFKNSPRVCAYGAVDDLSATLGFARSFADKETAEFILKIQKTLVFLMTELATANEDFGKLKEHKIRLLNESDLKLFEDKIQAAEDNGNLFNSWTYSGENHLQAALDMARTRCRFAEREIVALANSEGLARDFPLKYINRLSDLLWILSQEAK